MPCRIMHFLSNTVAFVLNTQFLFSSGKLVEFRNIIQCSNSGNCTSFFVAANTSFKSKVTAVYMKFSRRYILFFRL